MSKKGENIYKRKDNRWEGRYIKHYNPDETPKYGYCYAKTYREVKRKLSLAKIALANEKNMFEATQKIRFAVYCDEWLRIYSLRLNELSISLS